MCCATPVNKIKNSAKIKPMYIAVLDIDASAQARAEVHMQVIYLLILAES